MGKPFANELAGLEATYVWACSHDIGMFRNALRRVGGPLLAVGSGGSLTAAAYAAYLHEELHGQLARAATPLETVMVTPRLRHFHALILSAGGRNRDALQACDAILRAEPSSLTVLCGSRGAPLGERARVAFGSIVEELELPTGRDGFLATNSLFAFCILLFRAYAENAESELPPSLGELLGAASLRAYRDTLAKESSSVLERDVLLVLHGPSTRAAALDIESKFSEAALGSVHLADYRNFGHGRHHWLAKRAASTGVVAIVHESDEPLATRTLGPLPREVPTLRIQIGGSRHRAVLAGLIAGLHVTAEAGRVRDIDPGRPGVPAFGSRLYSLRMPQPVAVSRCDMAARRKTKDAVLTNIADHALWRKHAERALSAIAQSRFSALVLDYDGTICAGHERRKPLRLEIANELRRLLECGLVLGIATGRGQSVGKALREAIPVSLWAKVLIGYYNGGFVAPLDAEIPDALRTVAPELEPLFLRLDSDARLHALAKIEPRRPQIMVECFDPVYAEQVWDAIQVHLHASAVPGVLAVRSSHSLDILAPGVSKLSVVRALGEASGGRPIVRIGDRGKFPGNDFALLDSPLGLSVDEVSMNEASCWNFAHAGVRGVAATLDYLRAMRHEGDSFRVVLEERAL